MARTVVHTFVVALLVAIPFTGDASERSKQDPLRETRLSVQQQANNLILTPTREGEPVGESESARVIAIADSIRNTAAIATTEDATVFVSPWFPGRGAVGVAVDVTW